MALSKALAVACLEIDLKIHYEYYGSQRCTPLNIEMRELLSLGYLGLQQMIQSQVRYLGRMSCIRISYKDEENDYVDLNENNFNRFVRLIRGSKANAISDIPVVNLRVEEGASPYPKTEKANQEATRNELSTDRRELSYSPDEDFLDTFTYKSPLEHSLSSMREEIDSLNIQIVSAKEYLQSLKSKYQNQDANNSRGKQCSNCHLRLDHNIRQCRLEKCTTAEQCGDVKKHQDEWRLVEAAEENLKKLEKEQKSKVSEFENLSKSVSSANNSFSQKIRPYLINSDKKKYLIKTPEGMFVPRSSIVNTDLAKLEKYFQRKVPDNLEEASRSFGVIIENFDKSLGGSQPPLNPAKHVLENNSIFNVKFPRLDVTCTATAPSGTAVNSHVQMPTDLLAPGTGTFAWIPYPVTTPSATANAATPVVKTLPPKKRM